MNGKTASDSLGFVLISRLVFTDHDADRNRLRNAYWLTEGLANHKRVVEMIHNEHAKKGLVEESHLERRSASVHLRRQLQADLFGVAINRNDPEVAHLTNVKRIRPRTRSFRLTLPSSIQHRTQCGKIKLGFALS